MPRRRMYRAENSNLLDITKSNRFDLGELDALPAQPLRLQHQLLDEETQALKAVEATNNMDRGNKELDKAIKNNSSSRTFTLLFLFVLTILVLILDW
ncbi:hypothetical protein GIB67_022385 [Kingdonia uniflora]|uniref:t-SNARE coiled-coil homology domain-containing protein n=1 Tax=Kingdonia uniflora TaxID=39325 RepID=A0A7J7MTS3_9MAGN|nr:hypothetical protein GIB67_022385 [Kingdonia uniflora]